MYTPACRCCCLCVTEREHARVLPLTYSFSNALYKFSLLKIFSLFLSIYLLLFPLLLHFFVSFFFLFKCTAEGILLYLISFDL